MKTRGVILIVLAGILWGSSGIFVHYLSPLGYTPFMMSAVRGLVSFIAIAAFALIKDRSLFKTDIKGILFAALVGAALYGTATSYYAAIGAAGVAVAVVLMYTAPIYVFLFSVVFMKEKSSPAALIGIGMMIGGCVLTSGLLSSTGAAITGVLLGILAGIIYAVYNVSTKLALGRGMHPVTLTMYAFMFMTLFALPMSNPIGIASNAKAAPYSALLLVGLGIFTFVMPYFLYTLGMRDLSAPVATALGTVEPMAATLFDVCIFHTALEPLTVCGIVLIIAAVVILALTERKDRPNEA